MNISADRSGAKIIVFLVAAILVGAAGWYLYTVVNNREKLNENASVCEERGPGTHVISSDGATGRKANTVVMCNRDGTSQVLQQP